MGNNYRFLRVVVVGMLAFCFVFLFLGIFGRFIPGFREERPEEIMQRYAPAIAWTAAQPAPQREASQEPGGLLKLPPEFSQLSADGQVEVVHKGGKVLTVFFDAPQRRSNHNGYLLSTEDLTAADFTKDAYAREAIAMTWVDYVVDKKVSSRCLRVSFDLD